MPLAAIGLGLSALGLGARLFNNPESERQERYKELLARIEAQRQKSLTEGGRRIVEQTQGVAAASRQAAVRRAAAAGRTADTESYVLPAESQAYDRGTEAYRGFVENTNKTYDNAALEADTGFAGRPIVDNTGDVLLALGEGATRFGQDQEYMNILKENAALQSPTAETGVEPTSTPQESTQPIPGLDENTFGYTPQSDFAPPPQISPFNEGYSNTFIPNPFAADDQEVMRRRRVYDWRG